MIRIAFASFPAIVLAVCSGCGANPDVPADALPADELGRRIAGTWLGTYRIDGSDLPATPYISTYHADGTAQTTSSRIFGAGDAARHKLSSTHHLQWERSGEREIRWRLLHFIHEVDGSLTHISRTHGVAEFDENFEERRGTFRIEIFETGDLLDPPDPNRVDAQPVFTGDGSSLERRLHVRIPSR